MPFLENDLYLYRGDNKLVRGDWTSTVYKYDASSFYNWEQDNLPLYDLEERTELNWEQFGYPTSTIGGMQLTVSETAADTFPPYQVFSSVSGALAKLPRVIRFPIIIEVGVSGDLGNIDIEDFEFVGSGGLEIVNRGFSKVLCGSSTGETILGASGADTSSILSISSIDLSNTMADTSTLATSTNITTTMGNNWWDNWHRSIVRMADVYADSFSNQEAYGTANDDLPVGSIIRNSGITVTIKNVNSGFLGGALRTNTFTFDDYTNPGVGQFQSDYDAKEYRTLKYVRPSDLVGNLQGTSDMNPTGFVYSNSAKRIRVKNCTGGNTPGPIFIRGFVVDGNLDTATTEPAANHAQKIGIDVKNANVVLENCAAIRCGQIGLKVNNSNVILNRGFTSYRNYPLTGGTKGTFDAYGMQVNNSEVTLSASHDVSSGMAVDSPFSFTHSPVGVQLNNSTLKTPEGGRGKDLNGASAVLATIPYQQVYLDAFLNTETGLEANDSNIDFNHTIMAYQNETGIKLNNTTLVVDELVCDHNNSYGLYGINSTVEYYKNLHGINPLYSPNKILSFIYNGQHLYLDNCVFKNKKWDIWDNVGSNLAGAQNSFEIGTGGYKYRDGITVPGVHLKSTQADFLQVKSVSGGHIGYQSTDREPVLGEAYYIDENSDVKFLGTSGGYYTLIEGASSTYDVLLDSVPIYADNNSKVEFNGPTVLTKAGINVGANNNSVIKFAPHNTGGLLDVSSYALSDTNQHTRVELQSYKACLVADKGSVIEMKDCGDFNQTWSRSSDVTVTGAASGLIGASDYNPNNDNETTLYTSGGYIQFYPNPIMRDIDDLELDVFIPSGNGINTLNLTTMGVDSQWNEPIFDPLDYTLYSWGGVCVRADRGSDVKVLNTHFPCGWQNASSVILDVSAGAMTTTTCGKLYIWNIANNSKLHVSHVSVSGNYPENTLYHGPSGIYVSGTGSLCGGEYTELSAAPSSTPDTGRLSILDSFGAHGAVVADTATGCSAIEARTTFDNKGPFRIYFSVNPVANFIGYTRGGNGLTVHDAWQASSNMDHTYVWDYTPSAVELGEPYQQLSQGYNPSRDCSTPDPTTVSAIYNQLGFQTAAAAGGEPLSTTFFYASGMLDDSYVSRIWLDDSAMNTFANAKNATKGTSCRVKLVSYYRAVTCKYGSSYTGAFGNDGYTGYRNGYGLGFRSSNIFDFNRDT